MGKELRALNRIKDFMSVNAVHWKQDVEMIENALKEKEQQDEILSIIVNTFSLRNALLQVCEGEHKVFPKRYEKIKEWLK